MEVAFTLRPRGGSRAAATSANGWWYKFRKCKQLKRIKTLPWLQEHLFQRKHLYSKESSQSMIWLLIPEAVIQRCSVKKVFLEISQNSPRKCLRPATLLKKRLWHRCFSVNFAKFLGTPFLTEHLWCLLLYVISSKNCFTDAFTQNDSKIENPWSWSASAFVLKILVRLFFLILRCRG